MSDFIINIRFGLYHLQVSRSTKIRVRYNDYHKGLPHGLFSVDRFFWYEKE